MKTDENLLDNYIDDPDCGVDAASDQGYWLEIADRKDYEYLFEWRKRAGMSPELLSQLAPIPLEEYLLIEKGERIMTNGDAWRIDEAIIRYRVSKWTWFQRIWIRNRSARKSLRKIWESDTWGPMIMLGLLAIIHFGFLRYYMHDIAYVFGFFIGSALSFGLPACLMVWLLLFIVKELRNTE